MQKIPADLRKLMILVAAMRDYREVDRLLRILLTERERGVIAERWSVLQALASGMPQRDVAERCNVSISKVTRGAYALRADPDGIEFLKQRLRRTLHRQRRSATSGR